jgi:hypothetical protein
VVAAVIQNNTDSDLLHIHMIGCGSFRHSSVFLLLLLLLLRRQ